MTAIVSTLSSSAGDGWLACFSTFTSFPAFGTFANALKGYGVPLSRGRTFGCWSAWSAVK